MLDRDGADLAVLSVGGTGTIGAIPRLSSLRVSTWRTQPGLWHLALFRWNAGGGPRVVPVQP